LVEAIEGTLDLMKHELGKATRVEQDLAELPLVECYAQQVNQVFMNLMMNAAHAMGESGTLTIRARPAGDAVEVQVSDTGQGIAPENLERLFEPGFTTKGKRVGMGLGLAICQEIIDRHDGQISVQSEVGVGTTFTLRLPLRLADGKKPAATPSGAQT
jgi:two-component system NtrC family sensor kinase